MVYGRLRILDTLVINSSKRGSINLSSCSPAGTGSIRATLKFAAEPRYFPSRNTPARPVFAFTLNKVFCRINMYTSKLRLGTKALPPGQIMLPRFVLARLCSEETVSHLISNIKLLRQRLESVELREKPRDDFGSTLLAVSPSEPPKPRGVRLDTNWSNETIRKFTDS